MIFADPRTIGIFARERMQSTAVSLLITVDFASVFKTKSNGRLTNKMAAVVATAKYSLQGISKKNSSTFIE